MDELKSIFLDGYAITYTAEYLQIGCENHLFVDWWKFTDEEILNFDGKKALDWWTRYKKFIKSAILLSPATPTCFKEQDK